MTKLGGLCRAKGDSIEDFVLTGFRQCEFFKNAISSWIRCLDRRYENEHIGVVFVPWNSRGDRAFACYG
jgi:hypothetical protein